ncbi:MAG: peptidoglycan DD-metalloendopeptidase family protein [Bacteroidetes bacterium]|nr:peptidoglycan DD-metalloendopeptidase family protein [Bacteroidota bacterium]MDA0879003.1 peptidoglycan DD-metalloendopeptidase family protein [Bacteroidota bacterium]MDA1115910.1 peptidoglycan DD-metalloendopeptidase family protein [Bacteroidota bacterium]
MIWKHVLLGIGLVILASTQMQAQKNQAQLEERRQALQKEIDQINNLVVKGRTEQKSILAQIEELDLKLKVRQDLIEVTNDQINWLTRQIANNQAEITRLRKELLKRKEDYAEMIVKSFKARNEKSKLMFVLSAENFQQAYLRLRYIKQYAEYQKEQADLIAKQTEDLQNKTRALLAQKADKDKLIKANREAKRIIELDRETTAVLMAEIKRSLTTYEQQISQKQQESNAIDREIANLIRLAREKSNTAAGKSTTSKTFALTPEDKALAASFAANNGKLPWPVEKGVVVLRFGKQAHPVVKTAIIDSQGVRIATPENENVRAVFQGEVYAIMAPKYGNTTVMIQHGNYFTIYRNLTEISVKKGDKVSAKQTIGKVLKNKSNGKSVLNFSVFKDTEPQNPANWIYKM